MIKRLGGQTWNNTFAPEDTLKLPGRVHMSMCGPAISSHCPGFMFVPHKNHGLFLEMNISHMVLLLFVCLSGIICDSHIVCCHSPPPPPFGWMGQFPNFPSH